MTIPELLTLRDRARIQWHEPWYGLDELGNEVLVDAVMALTVDGAIRMRRRAIHELAQKRTATEALEMLQATEEELLIDQIVINWAEVVLDGTVIKVDIDLYCGQVPCRCADPSPGQNL